MTVPGLRGISPLRMVMGLMLVFSSGLMIGFFFGIKWQVHTYTDKQVLRLADGYQFINPLLECEIAGEQVEFTELTPFKQKINALVESRKSNKKYEVISVYFRDLNNGLWFGINEKEPFAPASLLKVPTMIAALKEAEQKPGFLSNKIKYDGRENFNDMETFKPEAELEPGKAYSMEELLFRSIAHSDNNANTMVFNSIDKGALAKTYKDLGLPLPTMVTPENFMSVKQYASFFRILFNASYLSKDMSEKALSFLYRSRYTEGIVAGLPPDMAVAHKFGERTSVANPEIKQLHDCGIIYYPERPYLLCIMSKGKDFSALNEVIKDISRTVFEEVDSQSAVKLAK